MNGPEDAAEDILRTEETLARESSRTYTCPSEPRHVGDLAGCGATFEAAPDSEGLVDCPECGLFFKPERNRRASRFMSLPDIAAAIERDRRESDKVLTYAQMLHGIAHELEDIYEWMVKREGDAQLRLIEAWALMRNITGKDQSP